MPVRFFNRWMHLSLAAAALAVAAATLALPAHAATPTISFNAQRVYPVGPDPDSVAMGDFNHDGKPDMAVALNGSDKVAISLGNGDGTFQPPITFTVGSRPDSIAVGDFNGDGKLDLAVANASSNTISILLGNGDGTFQPQVAYAVGTGPASVVVADFNGDGKPDLAVANAGAYHVDSATVSILLGSGDGTFQPQATYTVGAAPTSIVVRDLNGDGKADLAVACRHAGVVSILLGKGNGSFQPAVNYAAGAHPVSIAAGDFNGDGRIDLAVADGSSSDFAVSILLGNGGGTFQPAVGYISEVARVYGVSVAVGDFNGDRKLDVVVGVVSTRSDSVPYTVSVLSGNGDGAFQPPVMYAQNGSPVFIAVSDLNGDGTPDLVTANLYPGGVNVLLGNRDGTFRTTVEDALPGSPDSVAVGDFNGDGIPDLAVTGDGVMILLGNGDSTFQPPVSYPAGYGAIAVGDFNGDGILDLAVADYGDGLTNPGNTVFILLGNGDGTFQAAVGYQVGFSPTAVAVADFNGDGKLDLAVTNAGTECCPGGSVSILLGNGDGSFQPQVLYKVGAGPTSVAVGDFNGDGKPDLVVTNRGNDLGNISVLLNHGDGTFAPQVTYAAGDHPASVAVGDFNADGKLDLAVADSSSNTVSILLGDGNGVFQPAVDYPIGSSGIFIIAGDFNGDGKLDLAVTNSAFSISVLPGNGDGTFQPQAAYATGNTPAGVASGDFNGNGKTDLVVANSKSSNISILTNTSH